MKILSIIGARPQFIKAATVSRTMGSQREINEIILHTGQHYDDNMSEVFFRELDIPRPDYNLGVGSGSHAEQTGSMLKGIEEVLILEKPDLVLVYGDTNSTIAGALAAVKLHIRVVHVEAGLRSFNRFMPEEINRIVTDRISDLLFAPTRTAMENLQKEGLAGVSRFSGDVMYDSVLFYLDRIKRNPEQYALPGIPDTYHLATIHRAENTDNPKNLKDIFTAFGKIEKTIVFPVHPRTRKILLELGNIPANVNVIDPVGYLQMLNLTRNADKVLTDSGGLQKEAYFLGKQCVTLRTETEWLETTHDNWNIITGSNPEKIVSAILADPPKTPVNKDFGDGNAAGVILENLLRF